MSGRPCLCRVGQSSWKKMDSRTRLPLRAAGADASGTPMREVVVRRISHKSVVGLDLLRGIAALVVFLGHVRGSCFVEFGALPPEQQGVLAKMLFGITRTGHEAVIVFFVLSGFLVGGQVINRVREGRFTIAAYVLDRTTRIFIPLIPACLFTVALSWLVFGQEPSWSQTLLNMWGLNGVLAATLPGDAPLWTLAYEIWFYILAGAVGHLLNAPRRGAVAFLAIACSVGVFCVLDARYVLFWWMGAVSILVIRRMEHRFLALVGSACLVFGIVASQLGAESKSFVNVALMPAPAAEALITLGICLLIPYFTNPTIDSALEILRKPALYLSSISFTLYLFHFPLNQALSGLGLFPKANSLSWHAIWLFSAKIAVLLILINIIYLAFEGNTFAVRRYLQARLFVDCRHVG